MNILSKVTWKSMRKNKARTIVTIVGIILSTAMFMAVTTLGYSLWDYMVRREIYNSGEHYLRYHYTSNEHIDALSRDDRISKLGSLGILGYTQVGPSEGSFAETQTFALAAADENFFQMVSVRLEEGRLPENSHEIVVDRNFCIKMENLGHSCVIGDAVELNISPVYEGDIELPADGEPFTRIYTVVGIAEPYVHLSDYDLYLSHLFTFAQPEDAPVWYRVYAKTYVPEDAMALMEEAPEGISAGVNHTLLALYGVTYYQNYNTAIIRICCVLAAIIMVGSVSLIYNAFSISVSERTKQFGLLASVGATRRQLRWAVYAEAGMLGSIGIPIGILSGYAGIAVTLKLLSPRIHTLLSTGNGTVYLEPIFSPLAIAVAAAIALITILISAILPARRAAGIDPIDAIRQKNDYAVPEKNIRVGKLAYKLFGMSGVLSKKYYKVSKKKYRATVISLVISIILFICAATISQMLQATVDRVVDTEAFDMTCYGDEHTLESLRQQTFVEDSVYTATDYYTAYVPEDVLSEEFLAHWDMIHEHYDSLDKNMPDVMLIYLEDAVFRDFLAQQGLPEAPYFSESIPSALVIAKELTIYDHTADGTANRYTYQYAPFNAEGQQLQLIPFGSPSGLNPVGTEHTRINTCDYFVSDNGEPILAIVPVIEKEDGRHVEDWDHRAEYLIRWETDADGITTESYYLRNIVTGEVAATPELVQESAVPQIRIGATVEELPFGVSIHARESYGYQYLVLPMSAAGQTLHSGPDLCITVSDYPAARSYLDIHLGELNYRDYRESEEMNRTLVLLINVFSYGFIILISLICVANVFNTISTNVALRKRDFGMLRSTGFREKDLLKMMHYECMTYGFKALAWGIPTSLFLSFWIQSIDKGIAATTFLPPWRALLIAALCVFCVVFITMFYALAKLRNDNLIDAIRTENT